MLLNPAVTDLFGFRYEDFSQATTRTRTSGEGGGVVERAAPLRRCRCFVA
jgi:hypothetical protein